MNRWQSILPLVCGGNVQFRRWTSPKRQRHFFHSSVPGKDVDSARLSSHVPLPMMQEHPNLQADRKETLPADSNWTVLRSDDNGNRFVIAHGLSHAAAQTMVKQFEDSGHKQCYWIKSASTEASVG